jgi:hypothetical protein
MFPDFRFLYCSTNKNLILSLSIYRDVYSCVFLSYLSNIYNLINKVNIFRILYYPVIDVGPYR